MVGEAVEVDLGVAQTQEVPQFVDKHAFDLTNLQGIARDCLAVYQGAAAQDYADARDGTRACETQRTLAGADAKHGIGDSAVTVVHHGIDPDTTQDFELIKRVDIATQTGQAYIGVLVGGDVAGRNSRPCTKRLRGESIRLGVTQRPQRARVNCVGDGERAPLDGVSVGVHADGIIGARRVYQQCGRKNQCGGGADKRKGWAGSSLQWLVFATGYCAPWLAAKAL